MTNAITAVFLGKTSTKNREKEPLIPKAVEIIAANGQQSQSNGKPGFFSLASLFNWIMRFLMSCTVRKEKPKPADPLVKEERPTLVAPDVEEESPLELQLASLKKEIDGLVKAKRKDSNPDYSTPHVKAIVCRLRKLEKAQGVLSIRSEKLIETNLKHVEKELVRAFRKHYLLNRDTLVDLLEQISTFYRP